MMHYKNEEDMNDFNRMTKEQKRDHCDWCWKRTCYTCSNCPIWMEQKGNKIQFDISEEQS